MRLEATATILTGPDVASIWAGVPDTSRQSYGSLPVPGQPIAQALDNAKQPDPASFAILRLTVQTIDALHLGPHHRRARFDRNAGWVGTWLALWRNGCKAHPVQGTGRSDRRGAQRRQRLGIQDQPHAKAARLGQNGTLAKADIERLDRGAGGAGIGGACHQPLLRFIMPVKRQGSDLADQWV